MRSAQNAGARCGKTHEQGAVFGLGDSHVFFLGAILQPDELPLRFRLAARYMMIGYRMARYGLRREASVLLQALYDVALHYPSIGCRNCCVALGGA